MRWGRPILRMARFEFTGVVVGRPSSTHKKHQLPIILYRDALANPCPKSVHGWRRRPVHNDPIPS